MISLFLGPDDFSKKEQADAEATAAGIVPEVLNAAEGLPMDKLISQDLFSGRKLFVVQEGVKFLDDKSLKALKSSRNDILFFEEKLDKRSKLSKELLADKTIRVKEFLLPHGRELDQWLLKRVQGLGGNLEPSGAEELAVRLGRDEGKEMKFGGKIVSVEEVFTLWQADAEIRKLLAFAGSSAITREMVEELSVQNGQADVLDIINAVGAKDMRRALGLINRFLEAETAADEKGKIIQLNALLSEQFRTVAIVQDFIQRRIPEAEILGQTGWKSGRLFVLKKIAAHFPIKKVLETLTKLSSLDEELKSSQTPPRVLLDLIMVQLLAADQMAR